MTQYTARSKQTGERCKRMCAEGKTVCKWHGGNSPGATMKNKNAEKHGSYSKLNIDNCLDEELNAAESFSIDPVLILQEQIKIIQVKEMRLAKKMKEALIAEMDAGKTDDSGKKKSATTLLSVSTVQTQNALGETSKTVTSNSESHSIHYLRLEDAHTRLLSEIRRAVNNLSQLQAQTNEESKEVARYGVLVTPGLLTEDAWEKAAAYAGNKGE